MKLTTLLAICALTLAAQAQTPAVYQPTQVDPPKGAGYLLPDGSVRIVGSADIEHLTATLNALYTQTHPGTKFSLQPANNNGSIYSLMFDATAFAPISTYFGGSLTYADVAHGPAVSIRMAHGSLQPQAKLSPLAVIVNPANSMSRASIGLLSSIFTQQMRRTVDSRWSQAGVKGDLGEQTIVPCGLPWTDHYPSEDLSFGDDVFSGKFANAPPVESYTMFKTYAEVTQFVAKTPAAIGIVALNQVSSGVRIIGIVDTPLGKPQTGTAAEIAAGHYPLDRFLYINVHAVSGQPLDPFVLEYMRMVLSPDGQRTIAQEGEGYIPLTPLEAANELAKLE